MSKEKCENCNKELHPKQIIWLEKHAEDGKWYGPDTIADEQMSLGYFPFDRSCALRLLRRDQPRHKNYHTRQAFNLAHEISREIEEEDARN